ncbi:MAG: DUF1501 domain-containing protein [Sandaracinaceae bacterium]
MPTSRRQFLRTAAITVGSLPFAQIGARAQAPVRPGRPVLVTVFLRGAMDSLGVVARPADRDYQRLRPSLGLVPPDASAPENTRSVLLEGAYALHPNLTPLLTHRDSLTALVGTGLPRPLRSHFDAQLVMERFGARASELREDGWLTRVAAGLPDRSPTAAVAIGTALPHSLARADAVTYTDRRRVRGGRDAEALFRQLYAEGRDDGAQRDIRDTGRRGLETLAHFRALAAAADRESGFGNDPLSRALRTVSSLIRGDDTVQLVNVDHGSWDTHRNQRGMLGQRTRELGTALSAFWQSLGRHRERVVLATLTEFGRTAAPNGTAGTDHGWGSAMFVLGTRTERRVLGAPAYGASDLEAGRDLRVTIDYRDVLAEIATAHLGLPAQALGGPRERVGLFA